MFNRTNSQTYYNVEIDLKALHLIKFSLITLNVSFLFSCGGGGEGRDNLKCLRLQPGEGAGEKLSNEEGVIIYFISAKPSNPTSPGGVTKTKTLEN